MGMVKVNPCTAIDLPRARREEMLFLTADEVRAVAEQNDPHYRVLVYTAAYTGLRAGELAGLQRQDVDLLRGVIHVRRALKDINGHLELGPTKTHAQRTVSLPGFLKTMLTDHLARPSGGSGPEAPNRLDIPVPPIARSGLGHIRFRQPPDLSQLARCPWHTPEALGSVSASRRSGSPAAAESISVCAASGSALGAGRIYFSRRDAGNVAVPATIPLLGSDPAQTLRPSLDPANRV
jgi:hypothetical protein